jgi:hypothetical protein
MTTSGNPWITTVDEAVLIFWDALLAVIPSTGVMFSGKTTRPTMIGTYRNDDDRRCWQPF